MREVQAEVRRCIALDLHIKGGLVGLNAGIQIDQTRDAADFLERNGRQAFQLGHVGALDRKQDLLLAAHRVQQTGVRHGDARHLA